MKYRLEKVGEPGDLHIEHEDVVSAHPASDGLHAVELTLRPRPQYSFDEGFSARRDKAVVSLVARQAQALIEQDRQGQTGYCDPCYDFGRREKPGGCVRCQVLEAYRKAGKGDLRKTRPIEHTGPGNGMAIALFLLVIVCWWALYHWGEASVQLEAANREVQFLRKGRLVER